MFPVNQDTLYTSIRRGLRPVKYITHINNASEVEKASREALIKSLDRLNGLSSVHTFITRATAHDLSKTLRLNPPLPLSAFERYYERYSVQRAVISRTELKGSIARKEANLFLFRLYGRFGLPLNDSLRKNKTIKDRYNYSGNQVDDYRLFMKPRRGRCLLTMESLTNVHLEPDTRAMLKSKRYIKLIANLINEMIVRYSVRFPRGEKNHFFRISRVKSNVYGKDPVTGVSAISVGDVVVDYGFLSVGMDAKTIIYRYSSYEASATHVQPTDHVPADEEEVLYVIESNLDMKALDIAGFKSDAGSDFLSSGEFLVQPGQRFRIAAIGSKPTGEFRRAVVLEPVADSPVGVGSFKDMFNGTRIGLSEI